MGTDNARELGAHWDLMMSIVYFKSISRLIPKLGSYDVEIIDTNP